MQTLNEHEFPPGGGWTFRQPQTNWVNNMAMVGFKASVDAIRKHRLANPAVTLKYNLTVEPSEIAAELKTYTEKRLGIVQPAPSFFQPSSNPKSGGVAAGISNLKRAAQGTAVVLDWLTSGGKPVAQELANARAATCVACPKNVDGSWYTTAPAELIRETLSARSDLKLETQHDAGLKSCDVCRCLNRLKVWCPMEHIAKATNPDIMAEFPPNCWIARRA